VDDPVQSRAQFGFGPLVGDAEDHPRDHLEGERVHPVQHAHRGPGRPAPRFRRRDLGDQRPVAAQCGTVEGGHEQPARPRVLGLVGQQQRMRTHDRAQDLIALARVQIVRVAREDLLDVFGAGVHHHAVGERRNPQGEDVAVAARHRGEEAGPVPLEQHALHERRQRRPGREPLVLGPLSDVLCGHDATSTRVSDWLSLPR
jgi:hypothetical protein